jgi:hypothetical protein
MEFYNYAGNSAKTMTLYDCVEPLQQPIGFVHFTDRPITPALLATATEIEAAV